MEWISVEDRLPTNKVFKKFRVKILIGSVTAKEIEMNILGRDFATGYRFMTGDWQRVTHWQPLPEPPIKEIKSPLDCEEKKA